MPESENIKWHYSKVTKEHRRRLNNHKSAVIWFTGLSGSGKSTISVELEKELHHLGVRTYRLDGDNIRHGLNKDLGFGPEERKENIRRIGEVSKLMADAGLVVLTAFISPYRADRDDVRNLMEHGEFIEVFVDASIETCELRDPKGLYKKVRAGKLTGFTGIDAPYEAPVKPEITVSTDVESIEKSVQTIISYLRMKGYLISD
ncbi:adenylyl-sulfate kinase [Oceanobacillus oncorhynchi subsp. incaldanensis]|uniref:Adenylyl-sulfate kinase n=1 Tax=Oceanobacillus oncorhynchi TaxID=545501 RepID=A0A0A1MX54_9BACI|nr:adenylyl-sulfate kinase [Oceanobacillus oncorhynchi]GIO19915.1 adenylyl-sulfate kinase [Oceanobacillus oncorhynchi subsp. incaldanensis]CEI83366.1 Adenylyl-sulfate kinase [Oceanobacillus oncorhynchi]